VNGENYPRTAGISSDFHPISPLPSHGCKKPYLISQNNDNVGLHVAHGYY
jgi:hypothetical protein